MDALRQVAGHPFDTLLEPSTYQSDDEANTHVSERTRIFNNLRDAAGIYSAVKYAKLFCKHNPSVNSEDDFAFGWCSGNDLTGIQIVDTAFEKCMLTIRLCISGLKLVWDSIVSRDNSSSVLELSMTLLSAATFARDTVASYRDGELTNFVDVLPELSSDFLNHLIFQCEICIHSGITFQAADDRKQERHLALIIDKVQQYNAADKPTQQCVERVAKLLLAEKYHLKTCAHEKRKEYNKAELSQQMLCELLDEAYQEKKASTFLPSTAHAQLHIDASNKLDILRSIVQSFASPWQQTNVDPSVVWSEDGNDLDIICLPNIVAKIWI